MRNTVLTRDGTFHGNTLIWCILGFSFLLSSCSTIRQLPREGSAAKFNLATVEYVNKKTAESDIKAELDSLLTEDSKNLAEIESLKKSLDSLSDSLGHTNKSLSFSRKFFNSKIDQLTNDVKEMQKHVDKFSDNIEDLPTEAIRELNKALEEYLNKESVPATQQVETEVPLVDEEVIEEAPAEKVIEETSAEEVIEEAPAEEEETED